jgi:hypothetical protein
MWIDGRDGVGKALSLMLGGCQVATMAAYEERVAQEDLDLYKTCIFYA